MNCRKCGVNCRHKKNEGNARIALVVLTNPFRQKRKIKCDWNISNGVLKIKTIRDMLPILSKINLLVTNYKFVCKICSENTALILI